MDKKVKWPHHSFPLSLGRVSGLTRYGNEKRRKGRKEDTSSGFPLFYSNIFLADPVFPFVHSLFPFPFISVALREGVLPFFPSFFSLGGGGEALINYNPRRRLSNLHFPHPNFRRPFFAPLIMLFYGGENAFVLRSIQTKKPVLKLPLQGRKRKGMKKTFFPCRSRVIWGEKSPSHFFSLLLLLFPRKKTPPRPCCGEWGGGGPPRLWWRVGVEFFIKSFFEGWRKNKSCPTTTAPPSSGTEGLCFPVRKKKIIFASWFSDSFQSFNSQTFLLFFECFELTFLSRGERRQLRGFFHFYPSLPPHSFW